MAAKRSLDDREGLPEEGRALFYVLQQRLSNSEAITVYPGQLVEDISVELRLLVVDDKSVKRGRPIEPQKVGSLLKRYGFTRGKHTNKGTPYLVTRSEFSLLAKRFGFPLGESDTLPADAAPESSDLSDK